MGIGKFNTIKEYIDFTVETTKKGAERWGKHHDYQLKTNNWLKFHGRRMRRKPFKREQSLLVDEFYKYGSSDSHELKRIGRAKINPDGVTLERDEE